MQRPVSILLLVLMVAIQTPVGQLFKLPLLIEHFIKHQKQDGVSFIVFLEDHYSSGHNDADWPEDEQLPFKCISFYNIGYAIVPGSIKAMVVHSFPSDKKLIVPDTYTPQQHLGSIFHPPRVYS